MKELSVSTSTVSAEAASGVVSDDLAPKVERTLTTGHSGSPTLGAAKSTPLVIALNFSNQVDRPLGADSGPSCSHIGAKGFDPKGPLSLGRAR